MRLGKPRSIELLFVNGDPEGLVTAIIPFQWTGHVLVARRTQIGEALRREETDRAGVYLLVGEKDGGQSLYVGETDSIRDRLKSHVREKDWWDSAIIITSSGEQLNKAHVRYLEDRLFAKAKKIGKVAVEFGRSPTGNPLSEAAKAHMDDFMENLMLVLPALGFDFYTENSPLTRQSDPITIQAGIPRFIFEVKKDGVLATARQEDGKFIVEKGSTARQGWIGQGTQTSSYGKLFRELTNSGVLLPKDSLNEFAKDYAFKSTSAAAGVVSGRHANGPQSWVLEGTTKKYADWESEQL